MQFRPVGLVALFVIATALAGCTAQNGGTTTTPDGGNDVTMKNLQFDPKEITISVGEAITWTNEDALPHDVTPKGNTTSWSPGGKGGMTKDETFTRTFDTAGVFEYYCQEHGTSMSGKVTVTA